MADDIDLAHEREEEFRLIAIERARQLPTKPNYTGICANCGEPIDPRRLKVLPSATRCIDCA